MKRFTLVVSLKGLEERHIEVCIMACERVLEEMDGVKDIWRIPTTSTILFSATEEGEKKVRYHFEPTSKVYEMK
jgi:hypothetical protein